MLQQLKRLGSDTAIYGISTIIGRALNFLLLPFYTNVLPPGDYGIVSYVFSIIAFVNVLYAYGMESGYFKYSSTLEIGTQKENFSTPLLLLVVSSTLFSLLMAAAAAPIAAGLGLPAPLTPIVYCASGVLAFDALAIIPFAALRTEHKPRLFASIKVVNIVITVVMNIILLVGLRTGVIGIFVSNLVASGCTLLMLVPTVKRHFRIGVNKSLMNALLRFGLPFIPAGLATMAVQVIDRPILRSLTDDATVGIYQASYRLGIFMMLIVQMYDFAWRPFYFSTAGEPNAKQLFARVLTYLFLFMSGIFLVVSFFIEDMVKLSFFGHHIIHPSYWGGLNIVPVVLVGYMFLGISNNMSAGIYIEKKTTYMPAITFAGALVNIAANYLLIPSMGMLGAAWATLLAYLVMALVLYMVVQKVYPIRYEFGRLLKIAAASGVVFAAYKYVPLDGSAPVVNILAKTVLLFLFAGMMYLMKFFERGELAAVKNLFVRQNMSDADVVRIEQEESREL